MKVRLVIEKGAKRTVVNLQPPQAVIGRSHGTTVRIPSSEVSRQHCRLVLENGLVTVEDLGSVNGTFLNGQKIQESTVARPGDTLEVGPVRFVIEYVLSPEAQDKLQEVDGGIEMLEGLEALAEGEEMELEELPVLHEMEEEESLPVLEELHEVSESESDETVAPKQDDDAPLPVDFDFDGSAWQMPEGGDLHDLLSDAGPEEEPPTKLHRPKR